MEAETIASCTKIIKFGSQDAEKQLLYVIGIQFINRLQYVQCLKCHEF